MNDYKVIHATIFNPVNAIFKSSKNDKANCSTILCNNSENCGLFKENKCSFIPILGWQACPYGEFSKEVGPTKRANSFKSWIKDREEKYQKVLDRLDYPINKYAHVGDYVYFPYSQATLNKDVKFLAHGGFFLKDNCFIHKNDWNINTIKSIVSFHPYAMCGGEILSYQQKEMPLFLCHLEETDNDLYQILIKECPHLIEKFKLNNKNHIGRKALLKTLKFPMSWETDGYKNKDGSFSYKVKWLWDGKLLTTQSESAYNETWGGVKQLKNIKLIIEPDENCDILVKDNNWVTKETKFID